MDNSPAIMKMSETNSAQKTGSEVARKDEVSNVTKLEMKNYILDDLTALKKKWSMINHKPEIDVNGEASNGSSINVAMKTSLFEIMKVKLVNVLKGDPNIEEIGFPMTSKATAKNGEEADVEYHLDITFKENGMTEKVKMKCYTTNCRVQIQAFGKHERKTHLANSFVPSYFANTFLVPFLKKELVKSFEFDKIFVPHLKQEIQRLQKKKIQDKSKKGSIAESDSKTAKCESNNCQHKSSVTLKNVAAYGCCGHCKGYEHFHCAGTSKVMKEEIKAGNALFICTNCMENNPALGKEISLVNSSTFVVTALVSNPQEGECPTPRKTVKTNIVKTPVKDLVEVFNNLEGGSSKNSKKALNLSSEEVFPTPGKNLLINLNSN